MIKRLPSTWCAAAWARMEGIVGSGARMVGRSRLGARMAGAPSIEGWRDACIHARRGENIEGGGTAQLWTPTLYLYRVVEIYWVPFGHTLVKHELDVKREKSNT